MKDNNEVESFCYLWLNKIVVKLQVEVLGIP